MQQPLVSVLVIMNDDLRQMERSLLSLTNQTYSNTEVNFIFSGKNQENLIKLKTFAHTHFPAASFVKSDDYGSVPKSLNALIAKTTATYISILNTGDIFHPERLSRCVATAETRNSSILITYAEPLDNDGKVLSADDAFFKAYTRGLLTNIAAHPCLSFVILWNDVIISPGNILLNVKLFHDIGGFREFDILYVYDLFLRSAHLEEPVILTEKLISCRPVYTDRKLNEPIVTNDERAEIIRDHFLKLLAKPPINSFSDVFNSHPFMFAGVPWSQTIADAVDGMLEKRLVSKSNLPVIKSNSTKIAHDAKIITLLTHELTLTGAPVIILEMATLLEQQGYRINLVSQKDGPLRDNFESRGIPVTVLPGLHPSLRSLENLLRSRPESRRELIGFFIWLTLMGIGILKQLLQLWGNSKLPKLLKGEVLINSIASWEWVYLSLKRSHTKITWYIHETFDPKWLAHAKADKLFRKRVTEGKLIMLYGSDATRKAWTSEGYPGQVKYWSGIGANVYPGLQLQSLKGKDRRVILNVGMVGSRKGTRVLLEAFALGRKQGIIPQDVELCIVGCPKPSAHQEARDILFRANKPDLQGYVRLVGEVYPEALNSYYDEADIYAHASFFDCMPIALLTAMARGMPIVATDVDGCGEAIINEVSGLLVPPRAPQMLAEAIARLLKDKPLAEQVAKGARDRFVNVFSVEATFEAVRNVLDPKA